MEDNNQEELLMESDDATKVADPDNSLSSFVMNRFNRAKDGRYIHEKRWLKAYQNYRGLYGADVQFTEQEKSRVFVKVTKTKVLAAHGQIIDVLLGGNKFPISIEPTSMPEGISESVHLDIQGGAPIPPQSGPSEEDMKLQPGETMQDLKSRLGALKKKLEPVSDKIVEGPGTTPNQVTYHPAMVTSKKMEKTIHDQLEESHANKELRVAAFELPLFGSGILKGPFAVNKEYPKWENGEYKPVTKTVPEMSSVTIWNYYPDPDALNSFDCAYVIERHRLTRSDVRKLKKRPHFNEEAIDDVISAGENYVEQWWEHELKDNENDVHPERFEVLEFWGYVDHDKLEEFGVETPEEFEDYSEVCMNIWVSGGKVLRAIANPFKPVTIPYYAAPYEVNPYSLFGVGVAENMDDSQVLMNGFMRMAVDNAALAGNLLIEVDENNLAPDQDLTVYPGKVFRRQGGAPGQAIFGTKFPSTANENMQMYDKARQIADESTGFPSFAHGQTGVTGVGRTSSGISMLMSAANGSIRTVVKNIDDYWLTPLGKGFFHFNMQFSDDEEIKGDLEVKAQGTESLMANEVRSQRLMQFLSIVAGMPALMPFAKMDYIIREIAKSMDLDPEKVTNNLSDAAIQAMVMKQFQDTMAPPEQSMEGAPAVPQASDTQGSGNGNIGVGQAPVPGEQGFSGNVA